MAELERARRSSHVATTRNAPHSDEDFAARPIDYSEPWTDRTWAGVKPEIATLVVAQLGHPVDSRWGSYLSEPTVRRSRETGDCYRRQCPWCVGPTGVTLVDARQGGRLADGRFHPAGQWSVTVDHRGVRDPSVTILRRSAPPPPVFRGSPAPGPSTGQAPADPLSPEYGGEHGELWSTLPVEARKAIEHAVPWGSARPSEAGTTSLSWDRSSVEQSIWYERRGGGFLAAVYATREVRAAAARDDAARALQRIEGVQWNVLALRVELAATHAAALPNRRQPNLRLE
jgi:hypothetical protein